MSKVDNAHLEISHALGELAKLFSPEMKLTFVARHPTKPECFVICGEDSNEGLAHLFAREVLKESTEPRQGDHR